MNRLKLPGRFYELNIHYGLFVGGLGDFREIFLGLWDNFRGCIQQLLYNGQDLLAQLKNNKQVPIFISTTLVNYFRLLQGFFTRINSETEFLIAY